MDEHPHLERFHAAHEAFERGDHEAMRAWFADDFVWHEPGRNVLTGEYVGADAVFGLFDRIATMTDGRFETRLHDALANGRHLVAIYDLTVSRGKRRLTMSRVNLYDVLPDGRVTQRWGYVGDQTAFDDLFA
ncbi:MAG TPA: nuclear transport factor 2 family protein [Candidatus Limnocylindrales bacterium]|nr:nuclear transport factor 2 family protein [Candidatus Limnocylindrales bacterium]